MVWAKFDQPLLNKKRIWNTKELSEEHCPTLYYITETTSNLLKG